MGNLILKKQTMSSESEIHPQNPLEAASKHKTKSKYANSQQFNPNVGYVDLPQYENNHIGCSQSKNLVNNAQLEVCSKNQLEICSKNQTKSKYGHLMQNDAANQINQNQNNQNNG